MPLTGKYTTIMSKSKQDMHELLFYLIENVLLTIFLEKTDIVVELLIYFCMGFICPVTDAVLLNTGKIQCVSTLVQHFSCLGFQ